MKRHIGPAAALALSLGAAAIAPNAWAQPAGRCTRETLNVRGTPLSVSYCVTDLGQSTPGRDLPVRIAETYSTPHGTYTQQTTLRFIAGEDSSRVIEDLPLERVGLQGTLHLTLLLRGGVVRVDSAMLTPGAVTIK
jgi:hypothetical protein